MSTNAELEIRVARLESVVQELAGVVERISVPLPPGEGRRPEPPSPPGEGRRLEPPSPEGEGRNVERSDASFLSLAGISVLIFGGAYVLRAFTESGALPRTGGVFAGIAYAALWIWMADRAARRQLRRNALFHAATAAAIAFPLIWETTTQFHFVTPQMGAAIATVIGLVLLLVAWRGEQESIAWIGSIGAIGAALAIASPSNVLPPLIAGSVVGAATLHVAMVMRWTFVAWPAAALTNALAVMAMGFPLLHGGFERPRVLIAALAGFAALWFAAIVARRARMHEDPALFDICETAILTLVGFGGAATIALATNTAAPLLGLAYLAAAVSGHVMAVTWRGALTAFFRVWIEALSACMTAISLLLVLPIGWAAVSVAVFGLAAMELGTRRREASMIVESVLAIGLAAAAGGIAKAAVVNLFSSSASDFESSAAALIITSIAVIAYVRATNQPIARAALLSVASAGAFFALTWSGAHLLALDGEIALALLRTVVLAVIAASLALLARFAGATAGIGVARAVLVAGGLKLVIEDVRLGRAAMLVAAFATYGFAMLIVARCARRHTSQPQAIQVTGTGDTFADAAPEKNVG